MNTTVESLIEWLSLYSTNLSITVIIGFCYLVFRSIVFPKIEEYIERDRLKNETLTSAIFSLNLFSGLIALALILFTWGFDFKELLWCSF